MSFVSHSGYYKMCTLECSVNVSGHSLFFSKRDWVMEGSVDPAFPCTDFGMLYLHVACHFEMLKNVL